MESSRLLYSYKVLCNAAISRNIPDKHISRRLALLFQSIYLQFQYCWRRCCRYLSTLQTTTDDDFCAINNLGSPLPAVDSRGHGSPDVELLQWMGLSDMSCSSHLMLPTC